VEALLGGFRSVPEFAWTSRMAGATVDESS
jgi:hypothetical protein